ncbi:carboxypeptidase regulatory-like domain-containing protein [Clostridium tarantellae]|uniref:Peptidase M60 domain-containing protein n=1 Tax=Clostridium tarantellae TaxID=39493 RepID=A0A6I1MKN1_9CLOT|nr:carboxypeptidase regulatory-like domain-containing protein [Clostridium tarantellae]MPQ44086.1 hypothetical protein [Clostridium tarantellae]
MKVKQDKYILTKSPTIQILKTGEDIKLDLKLSLNTKFDNIGAVVSGTVVDAYNTPIKGAIVKLMDANLQPLYYTETDVLGKYSIDDISLSSSYNMVATSTGKLLTPTTNFTLSSGETKFMNFTLYDDPNALLGAINGSILDSSSNPIFGAVVFLYNLTTNTPKLEAITYTDSLGGFILSEVLPGKYEIIISALGYNSFKLYSVVEHGKISNISKNLSKSSITSTGIISGIISNDSNMPIAEADVILYEVTDNKNLTPIAYTTTNRSGVYTFINVPIGSYLIKSTQSEVVDVNSTLSTSTLPNNITSTLSTSTLSSNEYNLALGILENNAIIDATTNLVSHLGGEEDGSATIVITVANDGEYKLLIEYLTADYDRFLSLDVNEINTGTIYTFPITDAWSINSIKTGVLNVNLTSGSNTLKFHGNGTNYAPDLGKILLSEITSVKSTVPNESIMNYDLSLGTLNNGATLDPLTNFVSYLGGSLDGSSTITVNIAEQGNYNLLIEYLCTANNTTLSIDVNEINTGTIYSLSPTKDLTLNSVEFFMINTSLKAGINKIKFYGDGNNDAPYLGKITISQATTITSTSKIEPIFIKAISGKLENGARIEYVNDDKVVGLLGGPRDGSVTLTVNIEEKGFYFLTFKYISGESRPLKIDVNRISTDAIYNVPKTNGWSISSAKTLTLLPIFLNSGSNTIKFHGDGTNFAPIILELSILKLSINSSNSSSSGTSQNYSDNETYNALDGFLENEAIIEDLKDGKIVGWLGGPKDGSVTLKVNVDNDEIYNVTIKYVSGEKRPFKLAINGKDTKVIYSVTPTNSWTISDAKTLNLPIALNSGENTIKFHGDGINYAPSIIELSISSSSSNAEIKYPELPTYNYNALEGLIENEARIENLKDGKVVGWLGGPKDGSVTIGINVSNVGSYNLGIKYVSGENRPFKITINGEPIETIYTVPSTNGWTISDAKVFTLPINLKSEKNFIKFHGDNENYAPSILSLILDIPTNSSVPIINIYRKTSLSPWSSIERKKFNIAFHTLEPLGIEIMYPTDITILIKGSDIKGAGDINLHDVDNIHYISSIPVNESKKISIPRKGELFLNVAKIESTLNDSTPFSFQIILNIENDINYIITPTFDIRNNKIFNKTITDETEFNKLLLSNDENGMLAISENVRLYFPKCKYIPKPISPSKVLALHEQTISEHNKLAGLDKNATNQLDRPRENFVLVGARNRQVGYMSAGGTMLDTHPTNSGGYFSAGWGIFHEYGHLYEQGWSHIDIWNNLYSANMSEKTTGFTWLWGNDRKGYENKNIEAFYKDYLIDGKFIERGFGFGTGLYFFISLQDFFGKKFIGDMTAYYRNNSIWLGKENYVVHAITKLYGINAIPYMEIYGYYHYDNEVVNFVIDNSNSSLIIIPNNGNFSKYSSISLPPTVKSIYAGSNKTLEGISNPKAQIKLTVNNKTYTANCNDKSKFSININEFIDENSTLKISSTEPNKTISVAKTILVKTLLSDNLFNFYGLGDYLIATIGFNVTTKTLIVKATGSGSHSYFGNSVYFSASLYDNTGKEIAKSSVTGNENAREFAKIFNEKSFEYGYYIKLTHAEPGRLSLNGNVINPPSSNSPLKFGNINLSKVTFYIRNTGIEYKFV